MAANSAALALAPKVSAVRNEFGDARTIVRTTYEGDAQAMRAINAGASGCLLKSALRKELLDAVRAVHVGRRYILAEVAHQIAIHAAEDPLSAREVAMLTAIAYGKAN